MSMTPSVLSALNTAPPHGVNEVGNDSLRQRLPLCLELVKEVLGIPWRGVVGLDATFQLIPKIFNRVEIWTTSRPVHPVDSRRLQVVLDDPRPVGTSIVVLKDSTWPHLL